MLKHANNITSNEHNPNQMYPGRNGKHRSRCHSSSYTLLSFPPSYV